MKNQHRIYLYIEGNLIIGTYFSDKCITATIFLIPMIFVIYMILKNGEINKFILKSV